MSSYISSSKAPTATLHTAAAPRLRAFASVVQAWHPRSCLDRVSMLQAAAEHSSFLHRP